MSLSSQHGHFIVATPDMSNGPETSSLTTRDHCLTKAENKYASSMASISTVNTCLLGSQHKHRVQLRIMLCRRYTSLESQKGRTDQGEKCLG